MSVITTELKALAVLRWGALLWLADLCTKMFSVGSWNRSVVEESLTSRLTVQAKSLKHFLPVLQSSFQVRVDQWNGQLYRLVPVLFFHQSRISRSWCIAYKHSICCSNSVHQFICLSHSWSVSTQLNISRKPLWLDLQPFDIKSRLRHSWKLAQVVNSHLVCDPTIRCGACRRKWGLTLICVLVARPRRCLTLSNPVPWQNWIAAYLGYTLRMKTLFCGWPVIVHDTHTRRRRIYQTFLTVVVSCI